MDLGLTSSDSVVHGSEGGAVDLELVPPVRLLCLSWRRRGGREREKRGEGKRRRGGGREGEEGMVERKVNKHLQMHN